MAKSQSADVLKAKTTSSPLADLASLYRSIGIASVASAVTALKMSPVPVPVRVDVPPLLRKDRVFD